MRKSVLILILFLTGCSATLPVLYVPQTYYKVEGGEVAIGMFRYIPALRGEVKSNQIKNSALGSIYIATDVDNFVKRATALELERAGVVLKDDATFRVDGNVLKLRAGDLGYSVQWTYEVNYRIINVSTGEVVFDKTYVPKEVKTGKFGRASDYTPSINELILAGIEGFLQDLKRNNYLTP